MQYEKTPKLNKGVAVVICAGVAAAVIVVLSMLGVFGGGQKNVNAMRLRCIATQDVTPFGDQVLYYDGAVLYCLSANGSERWSYALGADASFSAGENNLVAWVGNQLFIFDRDGRSTYNDHLSDKVQFARAGSRYVAAVVGEDTSPTLIVKDLNGIDVDSEKTAYEDMFILDAGFFSDGEYLWTTALDVYGTVPATKMYTIRVGQMNTGEVSLGEPMVYAVRYAAGRLSVVTTRQLAQYDYRGTQYSGSTVLVYGWQLIDSEETATGSQLLFATSLQAAGGGLSTLRLISGTTDTQFTLPTTCVGSALYRNRIYAFGGDSVYRAGFSDRRFTAMSLPLQDTVTGYLGMLSSGTALLCCGSDVYAVKLP